MVSVSQLLAYTVVSTRFLSNVQLFFIIAAMANIPITWAVQLFVNQKWFEEELLAYHRGLKRLVESNHPRLIITPLPSDLANLKPRGVVPSKWLWEHAAAERVLLFHGDGTLCSNTKKTWADFDDYHYVGVPWKKFDGRGGSGTEFSLRSRSAMLQALEFRNLSGPEDSFFVGTLLEMNKQAGREKYKIATPQVSQWFAGTADLVANGTLVEDPGDWGPMIVSGTQPNLDDAARNWVLGTCPELKVIFPVLHNPNCFGARPNPRACAASLGFELADEKNE